MSDFHFTLTQFLIFWFCLVSIITAVLTIYDKIAAKKFPKHRIPENTLIYLGILGGAEAELIVMLLIRHKTKHRKFMAGLPVIIAIHLIICAVLYFRLR